MIAYFRLEKGRMDRKRIAEATKGVGKPKVGGPFELVDQEGRRFTDEDLKGGYSLVRAPTIIISQDPEKNRTFTTNSYQKRQKRKTH